MAERMLALATLRAGQRLRGLVPGQAVTLIVIDPTDAELFEVFYRDDSAPAYDADPDEFRFAAEALRIKYAALYDPMVAVNDDKKWPQLRTILDE